MTPCWWDARYNSDTAIVDGACLALAAAEATVLFVPVVLLALGRAVAGVPAAVVHRLLLAVITLQTSSTTR